MCFTSSPSPCHEGELFADHSLLNRGCVTSILRTYYGWNVAILADKSYEYAKLSYWSWAELAAGTLVSCVTVLPKFLQHVSSRMRKVVGSSKSAQPDGGVSPAAQNKRGLPQKTGAQEMDSLKGPSKGRYLMLDDSKVGTEEDRRSLQPLPDGHHDLEIGVGI